MIFNIKRQEVCDKKKWEEENLPALLLVSLTFLILSHLAVGLLVSRVRAYLSTNQQFTVYSTQHPLFLELESESGVKSENKNRDHFNLIFHVKDYL
jgi:hypothetical protein